MKLNPGLPWVAVCLLRSGGMGGGFFVSQAYDILKFLRFLESILLSICYLPSLYVLCSDSHTQGIGGKWENILDWGVIFPCWLVQWNELWRWLLGFCLVCPVDGLRVLRKFWCENNMEVYTGRPWMNWVFGSTVPCTHILCSPYSVYFMKYKQGP